MKQTLGAQWHHKSNKIINQASKKVMSLNREEQYSYRYLPLEYEKQLKKGVSFSKKIEKVSRVKENQTPRFLNIDEQIYKNNVPCVMPDSNCFVEKLAFVILHYIQEHRLSCDAYGCISDSQYNAILGYFQKQACGDTYYEDELLIIYAKQLFMLLKKSAIIYYANNQLHLNTNVYQEKYLKHLLLHTFWNCMDWEDFFPSMPTVATALQENRGLFLELIFERQHVIKIHDLGKDFLISINASIGNELLFVSFLDFSLCTWLTHFGFATYVGLRNSGQVAIALTEEGKNVLSTFL